MAEPINGYRSLSPAEIALINRIKQVAEDVGALVHEVQDIEGWSPQISADQRWVAEARTDLQKGFMSLVRAVAKPEGF